MRTISGQIVSSDDQQGIPGVHLTLELDVDGEWFSLGDGTITDMDGNYSFTFVPGGNDNERIKLSHISHENSQIFPHLVPIGATKNVTMAFKTYEIAGPTITGWIKHNSNQLWLVVFGLLLITIFYFSTNGKATA